MEVDCKLEDPRPPLEESCVQLGDVKDMRLEAEAVVSDVLFAVTHMCVSPALSSTLDVAYINTETREGSRYCLELSEAGLRVVGHDFDQVDESLCCQYHETVYSLLDSLSPGYREAFGNALLQRLESLKQSTQQLDTCGQVEIRTREESSESSYLASRDGELSAASAAP